MSLNDKKVLIIGSGIAGLSAAIDLAGLGIEVIVAEKEDSIGGHVAGFTCKATDTCVNCGSCMIVEKIKSVTEHPKITVLLDHRISYIKKENMKFHTAFHDQETEVTADAAIFATGYTPFDPVNKPYGYRKFKNVITSLTLEKMLREIGSIKKLSDNKDPEHIAFIQCVGSRDEKLDHLWCSRVCCASALRMVKLINYKQPDIRISFFYIDIQTFGNNFDEFLDDMKQKIRMIRAIPGDVLSRSSGRLYMSYYNQENYRIEDDLYDMIILSVGITPNTKIHDIINDFGIKSDGTRFMGPSGIAPENKGKGVFSAGTAQGPMSITSSVASAGDTALRVVKYLNKIE